MNPTGSLEIQSIETFRKCSQRRPWPVYERDTFRLPSIFYDEFQASITGQHSHNYVQGQWQDTLINRVGILPTRINLSPSENALSEVARLGTRPAGRKSSPPENKISRGIRVDSTFAGHCESVCILSLLGQDNPGLHCAPNYLSKDNNIRSARKKKLRSPCTPIIKKINSRCYAL